MTSSIYSDEISAATKAPYLDNLEQDLNTSKTMSETLDNFINSCEAKTRLKGKQWDKVREKLNEFASILKERETCVSEFSSTIINSINRLNDCINSYTGNIPLQGVNVKTDIEQTNTLIEQCKNVISELEATISNYYRAKNEDKPKIDIRSIENSLEEQRKNLKDLEDYAAIVTKLKIIYEEEEKKLSAAFNKVSEFSEKVEALKPTNKFVYNPN